MSQNFLKTFVTLGAVLAFAGGCSNGDNTQGVSPEAIADISISAFPIELDKDCRNGKAKLYDECSKQGDLFQEAQALAKAEGKTVLVSYGAEWCIWCHVFDAYIHGYVEKFTYTYGDPGNDKRVTHTMRERAKVDVSQDAYDLKKYVSDNFVVAHIEYEHAPDGDDVLTQANAWDAFGGGVPYIFSVDQSGEFAAIFDSDYAEIRRDTDDWYRGYDRTRLLEELKKMRAAAVGE